MSEFDHTFLYRNLSGEFDELSYMAEKLTFTTVRDQSLEPLACLYFSLDGILRLELREGDDA